MIKLETHHGFRANEVSKYQQVAFWSNNCKYRQHGGYQCHGHALAVFDYLFGKCADCQEKKTNINNLYVGDLVRIYNNSHTIVIQDIIGENVYFTDANVTIYGGKANIIRWDAYMSKSQLASALTYIEHAPGNTIKTLYNGNQPFKDVYIDDWYYNSVKYTYDGGMIKGTSATKFSPNDKITRGQLVTILYRMEKSPAVTGKTKFPDVQDNTQYYYKAVKWATDKKIVSGYNTGKFGPNDNITREQLAVILNKYAKYKGKNVSATNNLSGFKDASKISSYATSQMKWAVGAGVITGNADKTLKPQGTATRAEASAMLEKYCKKVGR